MKINVTFLTTFSNLSKMIKRGVFGSQSLKRGGSLGSSHTYNLRNGVSLETGHSKKGDLWMLVKPKKGSL